ncbi:MAG: fused protease/ribonucleoside-triphosphate reductase [Candidatus Paceibacterota bacterium]
MPILGHGLLSQVVFLRSYARLKSDGKNESWREVVIRVMTGLWSIFRHHMRVRSLPFDRHRWEEFFHSAALGMFHMLWTPPGRGLWMMGTDFVYQRGSTALNNCAAISTKEGLVESASWAMDTLMNGGGVGFDTFWKPLNERGHCIGRLLPDALSLQWKRRTVHRIADSREGWVWSVKVLLNAFLREVPEIADEFTSFPTFDCSLIRPKGARINGFGGIASGPVPLIKLHRRIECFLRRYLSLTGRMSPMPEIDFLIELAMIDYSTELYPEKIALFRAAAAKYGPKRKYDSVRLVADIFNAIGDCVVSGNVRRSSEIAIGDPESETFLDLKNFAVYPERASIGHNSNNSIRFTKTEQYTAFLPSIATRIRTNGEPGLLFQLNMTRYGRIARPPPTSLGAAVTLRQSREFEEDRATLSNPCGEICLESGEFCNLSEVALNKFFVRSASAERDSFDLQRFLEALRCAAFYCKCVALLPCHSEETNAVIARNMRIGVSLSGIAVAYDTLGATRLIDILKKGYREVRNFDLEISSILGVVPSIRVTTCKPSGTISLLTGTTPGVHFAIAGRYAKRRIIIGKSDPLSAVLVDLGVDREDCVTSPDCFCFTFFIDFGCVRSEREVGLYEMLSLIATVQREWADNMVSATVTFDPAKEGPLLEQAIANFAPLIKSCAFFPADCTSYPQMPYEAISKEEFEVGHARVSDRIDLSALLDAKISRAGGRGVDPEQPRFCDSGACELPKRKK